MGNLQNFYKQVYTQDHPEERPFGRIQWKGTDVCIDLYCQCGTHLHFDGDFMYFIRCFHCKQVYAVGTVVKLIPLDSEQTALGSIDDDEIHTIR
jgi:hypothetical protein